MLSLNSMHIKKRVKTEKNGIESMQRWLIFGFSLKNWFSIFYNLHPNPSWYKLFSLGYNVQYWIQTSPANILNTFICFFKWNSYSEGVCLFHHIALNQEYTLDYLASHALNISFATGLPFQILLWLTVLLQWF